MKEKVAIVGGGIAGLTAAYMLNKKHDITLFEKSWRLGGNAYTHETKTGEQIDMAVASFVGASTALKFFSRIGAKVIRRPAATFLSIHNMETNSGLYMTPFSLKALYLQKFQLINPFFVATLLNADQKMRKLIKMLERGELKGITVAEAFELIPNLNDFHKDAIMAPLCLLSSMYYEEVLASPAEYFAGKLKEFDRFKPMSQMFGLRFPANFTKGYVDILASNYSDKIILNAEIQSVARNDKQVVVKMKDGSELTYDKIVFACNADQAFALLECPTDQESKLLGPWKYKEGLMVVHKDASSFPARELCQSWTCLQSQNGGATPHYSISICGWLLCPGMSKDSEYFATQHPNFPIKKDLLDFEKDFRTPLYDFESFNTIKDLPSLNGSMNSYYCGSHFGFGLHNDAISSALAVAKMLGVEED